MHLLILLWVNLYPMTMGYKIAAKWQSVLTKFTINYLKYLFIWPISLGGASLTNFLFVNYSVYRNLRRGPYLQYACWFRYHTEVMSAPTRWQRRPCPLLIQPKVSRLSHVLVRSIFRWNGSRYVVVMNGWFNLPSNNCLKLSNKSHDNERGGKNELHYIS